MVNVVFDPCLSLSGGSYIVHLLYLRLVYWGQPYRRCVGLFCPASCSCRNKLSLVFQVVLMRILGVFNPPFCGCYCSSCSMFFRIALPPQLFRICITPLFVCGVLFVPIVFVPLVALQLPAPPASLVMLAAHPMELVIPNRLLNKALAAGLVHHANFVWLARTTYDALPTFWMT